MQPFTGKSFTVVSRRDRSAVRWRNMHHTGTGVLCGSAVRFTVVQQAVVTGFSVEDDRDGFFEFGEQLF